MFRLRSWRVWVSVSVQRIRQTFSFLPSASNAFVTGPGALHTSSLASTPPVRIAIRWHLFSPQYAYSGLSQSKKCVYTNERTIILLWKSTYGGGSPGSPRTTNGSKYCLLRLVTESLRTTFPSPLTQTIIDPRSTNRKASASAMEAEYNQNLSYPGDRGLSPEVTEFKNRPSPLVEVSANND